MSQTRENLDYYRNTARGALTYQSHLSPSACVKAAIARFGRAPLARGDLGIRTFLRFVKEWAGEQRHPSSMRDAKRVWIFAHGSYSRVRLSLCVPLDVPLGGNRVVRLTLRPLGEGVYTARQHNATTGEVLAGERRAVRVIHNADATGTPMGVPPYREWETRGNPLPCNDIDLFRTEPC